MSINAIEDAFIEMLQNTPAWQNALPANANPADHVYVDTTGEELFEEDVFRPLAVVSVVGYASSRMTEGDNDVPVAESDIVLQLQRNASDFTTTSDQANMREFRDWAFQIINYLETYPGTIGPFFRFEPVQMTKKPQRTPARMRETHDDFWCVEFGFEPNVGGSE